MVEIIAYSICFIIIIVGIKESIDSINDNENIRYIVKRVLYYFSILLSFFIVNSNLPTIISFIIEFTSRYFSFSSMENQIARIVLLVIIYFIIQFIIYTVLKFLSMIFIPKKIRNYKILVTVSVFWGIIKGLIIILIMFVSISIFNTTIGKDFKITLYSEINAYDKIESIIGKNLKDNTNVVYYNDSDEEIATSNVLIYYNGVTLEDGIKSNEEIDNKAKELVKYKESDIDKARSIYVWIGSNIEYDFNKAINTLNNENIGRSGAIEAWNTRRGICFDYACLYVAMARAAGLNVRLVTGSAYDGEQYGAHAWNEVYSKEEERWISVDPTFYLAGNYFDNETFNNDHIKESIAGEW